MVDREKVIKGLEICSEHGSWHGLDCEHNEAYKDCPYRGCETGCVVTIAKDAIALLKEQQEQIEQMNFIYGFVYGGQVKEIKKLVRCNECKHRDPEDHKCDCGHDIQWQLPRADDWFCADGQQK